MIFCVLFSNNFLSFDREDQIFILGGNIDADSNVVLLRKINGLRISALSLTPHDIVQNERMLDENDIDRYLFSS